MASKKNQIFIKSAVKAVSHSPIKAGLPAILKIFFIISYWHISAEYVKRNLWNRYISLVWLSFVTVLIFVIIVQIVQIVQIWQKWLIEQLLK